MLLIWIHDIEVFRHYKTTMFCFGRKWRKYTDLGPQKGSSYILYDIDSILSEVKACIDKSDPKIAGKMPKLPKTFEGFLTERSYIYEAISQFLEMVLKFCVKSEEAFKPEAIGQHASSLILSLCKIHGFYGYPTEKSTDDPGNSCKGLWRKK